MVYLVKWFLIKACARQQCKEQFLQSYLYKDTLGKPQKNVPTGGGTTKEKTIFEALKTKNTSDDH